VPCGWLFRRAAILFECSLQWRRAARDKAVPESGHDDAMYDTCVVHKHMYAIGARIDGARPADVPPVKLPWWLAVHDGLTLYGSHILCYTLKTWTKRPRKTKAGQISCLAFSIGCRLSIAINNGHMWAENAEFDPVENAHNIDRVALVKSFFGLVKLKLHY